MTQPPYGLESDRYPNVDDAELDRIYRLLPPVIHLTDERAGRPLQALMRILARQANIIEEDLRGLYENWFIETCDDWVVPYLGELIGYKLVPENTPPYVEDSQRGRARMQAIVPRAEVADTIRFRRRKGSLLLLEEIAQSTVGWPARAVEYRGLIATIWHSRFPEISRNRTLDLRRKDVLRNAHGPFDGATRLLDMRRLNSTQTIGLGSVPSIGLWVWRLKSMLVANGWAGTRGRTELADHVHRFTFNPLGINTPLFTRDERLPEPVGPSDEFSVPAPISRRSLAENLSRYYGPDKSIYLQYHLKEKEIPKEIAECYGSITVERIEVADLTHWEKSIPSDHPFRRRDFPLVANEGKPHPYALIDPELGRMLVRPPFDAPQGKSKGKRNLKHLEFGVYVRYHHGSRAALGGGDYTRRIPAAHEPWQLWKVSRDYLEDPRAEGRFKSMRAALDAWDQMPTDLPRKVVIEIDDDGTFNLGIDTETRSRVTTIYEGEALVIRAASHRRPVIFVSGGEEADYSWTILGETKPSTTDPYAGQAGEEDDNAVDPRTSEEYGGEESTVNADYQDSVDTPSEYSANISPGSFALEGMMIGGINLIIAGNFQRISIRDSTLVAAEYRDEEHPYANEVLELQNLTGCLSVDRSVILGSIRIDWDEFPSEPINIEARDSIFDGAGCPLRSPALSGLDGAPAFASLLLQRCTVVGRTCVNRIMLAEDTLFTGLVEVAEPNLGCLRFCSVPTETALARPSTTPPRYTCQPDVFLRDYRETQPKLETSGGDWRLQVAAQVAPRFAARRFGEPNYMQLTDDSPEQIRRGASDESEMGAFHDLYLAQRMNLLRARLAEFTPAGADAAILFST